MIPNSGSSLQIKTEGELSARRLVFELKSLGAVLMADDLRRYHDQMLDIAERLADEEERLYGDREHLRLELRELRTEIDRQRRMLSDIRTLRGDLAVDEEQIPVVTPAPAFEMRVAAAPVDPQVEVNPQPLQETPNLVSSMPEAVPSLQDVSAVDATDEPENYDPPLSIVAPTLSVLAPPRTPRRSMPSVQSLFGRQSGTRATPLARQLQPARIEPSRPATRLLPVSMPAKKTRASNTAQQANQELQNQQSVGRWMIAQPPPLPTDTSIPAQQPALDSTVVDNLGATRLEMTAANDAMPYFETSIRPQANPQSLRNDPSNAQPETASESNGDEPIRPALRRRHRPFRPDFQIGVRWWNAIPVMFALAGVSGMLLWATTSSLQASMAIVNVQDSIERLPKDRRKLTDPITEMAQATMGKWDADRAYVAARGMSLAAQPGAKAMTPEEQKARQQAAYFDAARAVRVSPANRWFRMTLAQLAERMGEAAGDQDKLWASVIGKTCNEPIYWKGIAQHLQKTGKTAEALEAYQKYLGGLPEHTNETLKQLHKDGMTFQQLCKALPNSVISCSAAAEFFRQEGMPGWQQAAREFAEKFHEDSKRYKPDEWAARANLLKLIQRTDDAISSYERALAKAGKRNDWRIQLAKLHYEKGVYPECERLANIVLQTEPASDVADQARLLKERIDLATGKGLTTKAN